MSFWPRNQQLAVVVGVVEEVLLVVVLVVQLVLDVVALVFEVVLVGLEVGRVLVDLVGWPSVELHLLGSEVVEDDVVLVVWS
jgi:hypothetical protein